MSEQSKKTMFNYSNSKARMAFQEETGIDIDRRMAGIRNQAIEKYLAWLEESWEVNAKTKENEKKS